MKYNESRVPLNFQNPAIAKADKVNPSYKVTQNHPVNYKDMDDRPSIHAMSRMRRYPDGKLDYNWAAQIIIDAIHKAEYNGYLTPLEESMITVVFPIKFRKTEPAQAEVRTQLSRSEKEWLREYVEAQLKEELNYNAGRGGGSVPGRKRTLDGVG